MGIERHTCVRCRRSVTPRGGQAPRYCPVCGEGLPGVGADAVRRRATVTPAAPAALIVGMCSLIPIIGIPLGVVALGLGAVAREQIRKSPEETTGTGLATAGTVLGMVGICFSLMLCLGC